MVTATNESTKPEPLNRVFIYGTLIPGQVRWPYMASYVAHNEADNTPGLLYATPFGYPAARFDATGNLDRLIQGYTMTIHPHTLESCLAELDEIESAVTGLYHRVVIETGNGHHAWAYQYGLGIDDLRLIESGSWVEHQNLE